MGAYLSKPITKKETEVGEGNKLEYAASCMQGWRVSQEDAHNCITDLDDKSSLFAVYDGHGGAEVAIYLSRHYPEILKSSNGYKEGNWEQALHESYLKIDAKIKEPETIVEIQKIAKKDAGDDTDNIADYEEENVGELYEEATMPLEKLLKKYNAARAGLMKEFTSASEADPDAPKPGSSKSLVSPAVAASSSCSSSSSTTATGGGSSSSSSQALLSSSSSSHPTASAVVAGGSSSSSSVGSSSTSSSSSSNNIQEEQMTSSSTSGEGSNKKTNKIVQEIETEAAAADECCSSSSSSKKTVKKNTTTTTTNEIDTTAEAEIASGSSPQPETISNKANKTVNNGSQNGDVEPPSSSTSSTSNNNNKSVNKSNLINKDDNNIDADNDDNEAAAASIPRRSINGTDENVEPDSTENEAISANVGGSSSSSGNVHQNGGEDENSNSADGSSSATTTTTTAASTSTKPNGEGVADSTQSENTVTISIESPKRKGKIHPVPVPQSTRTSTRKKVDDSKVYKNFINEESASSESDEDTGGVQPFMHDSDSDEDDEDESVDDDDAEEEEEDGDEDDDDDDDDDEDEDEEDHQLISDMQEPGYDSGSTAVVAFMRWEGDKLGLWVANAGDSRCVVCRNGTALEMSHDHKPEEDIEARRIIRAGGKVTGDGRVNGGLNLSRAIGDHSYKQNTTLTPEEQMITPVPDIRHEILDPLTDQFLIVACDGVWNSLSSQEVVDFVSERLKNSVQISDIIEQLFDACLAFDTTGDGTGCDNMTAIIVKLPTTKPDKSEEIKIESIMDQESIKTEDESTDSSSNNSKRRLSTDENEVEVDNSKRLKTTSD